MKTRVEYNGADVLVVQKDGKLETLAGTGLINLDFAFTYDNQNTSTKVVDNISYKLLISERIIIEDFLSTFVFGPNAVTVQEVTPVAPTEAEKIQLLTFNMNSIAGSKILNAYPVYKQMNINELQGYSQTDKDTMWIFINGIRTQTNDYIASLATCTTFDEINAIEAQFFTYIDTI